jgi:hypothetical protein
MTDPCTASDPDNNLELTDNEPTRIEVVVRNPDRVSVNPWQAKFDRVKHRRSKEWCDEFRRVVLKQDPD